MSIVALCLGAVAIALGIVGVAIVNDAFSDGESELGRIAADESPAGGTARRAWGLGAGAGFAREWRADWRAGAREAENPLPMRVLVPMATAI